jgi:hypothetical protein
VTFREQLAALIYDTELKYRERTSENTDYRLLDDLAERIAAAFEPIDVLYAEIHRLRHALEDVEDMTNEYDNPEWSNSDIIEAVRRRARTALGPDRR